MKARRIRIAIALFIMSQLSTFAQEFSFVAERDYELRNSYPYSKDWEEDGRTVDVLKRGDTVIVYAYDNKLSIVSVYNQRQMGELYLWMDKTLIEQIKKAKVQNPNKKKDKASIAEKEQKIKLQIDAYHANIRREKFVRDSLERRRLFVADSLEKRRLFVLDSIARREAFVKDSLAAIERKQQDSIRAEKSRLERKLYYELVGVNEPFLMDVIYWSVDHERTMSMKIGFLNCSRKVVKYITIYGRFLNSVYDIIPELWTGKSTWKVIGIGPIYPAPRSDEDFLHLRKPYEKKIEWENLYYFYPAKIARYMEITSVTIEYMDGTKRKVVGKALQSRVSYPQ